MESFQNLTITPGDHNVETVVNGTSTKVKVKVDIQKGIDLSNVIEVLKPGVFPLLKAKPVPVPLALPTVARPGYLRLNWPSEIGKAYQVQVKGRLEAFAWTNLSFVTPATTTNTMLDLPMSGAAQFMRVVEAD